MHHDFEPKHILNNDFYINLNGERLLWLLHIFQSYLEHGKDKEKIKFCKKILKDAKKSLKEYETI